MLQTKFENYQLNLCENVDRSTGSSKNRHCEVRAGMRGIAVAIQMFWIASLRLAMTEYGLIEGLN